MSRILLELGKTKQPQLFVWVNTTICKTTRKGLVRKGALGKTLLSIKLQCLLLVVCCRNRSESK